MLDVKTAPARVSSDHGQLGDLGDSTVRLVQDVETPVPRRRLIPMRPWERKFLLVLFDLIAVNGSVAAILWIRSFAAGHFGLLEMLPWFALPSTVWIALAQTVDLYDVFHPTPRRVLIPRIAKVSVGTYAVFLLIPFVMPSLPGRRLELVVPLALMVGLAISFRLFYLRVFDSPSFGRTVLIYGAGWAGRTIAELLVQSGNHTFNVLGFLDDDVSKIGGRLRIAGLPNNRRSVYLPVLGGRDAFRWILSKGSVDCVVLAITHDVDGELLQLLMDGLEKGIEIVPMPVLYEQLTGRVPIEHVGDNSYVAMPVQAFPSSSWRIVKRTMDICLASLGLLFLFPFLPLIALLIYVDSPGPVFYTQTRVGRGGKLFRIYKFRSMVPNAENGKALWAKANDSRVTRVGKLLRKTHLDEFPQFWNILKGDMSVVGPRPERPEFVAELSSEIPFYRVRHAVKPGMAGWALVKHGYASSKEDAVYKLQYDLYYVKHQSLWFDIEILLKTFADAITFRGRA